MLQLRCHDYQGNAHIQNLQGCLPCIKILTIIHIIMDSHVFSTLKAVLESQQSLSCKQTS